MSNDIGRNARQVLPRREAIAVVSLAELLTIFHDAGSFTVKNDAVLSDGDLVNSDFFGD
jgi:hypothetical protein